MLGGENLLRKRFLPMVSLCQMKLQQAKESFMERLARERRERESGGRILISTHAPFS